MITTKEPPKVICVEDAFPSIHHQKKDGDCRTHLKKNGSTRTLCGKAAGRDLPFLPVSVFGNLDGKWCARCGEAIGLEIRDTERKVPKPKKGKEKA